MMEDKKVFNVGCQLGTKRRALASPFVLGLSFVGLCCFVPVDSRFIPVSKGGKTRSTRASKDSTHILPDVVARDHARVGEGRSPTMPNSSPSRPWRHRSEEGERDGKGSLLPQTFGRVKNGRE